MIEFKMSSQLHLMASSVALKVMKIKNVRKIQVDIFPLQMSAVDCCIDWYRQHRFGQCEYRKVKCNINT